MCDYNCDDCKNECDDVVDGRWMEAVNVYASTCDGCGELTSHEELLMDDDTQLGYCWHCLQNNENVLHKLREVKSERQKRMTLDEFEQKCGFSEEFLHEAELEYDKAKLMGLLVTTRIENKQLRTRVAELEKREKQLEDGWREAEQRYEKRAQSDCENVCEYERRILELEKRVEDLIKECSFLADAARANFVHRMELVRRSKVIGDKNNYIAELEKRLTLLVDASHKHGCRHCVARGSCELEAPTGSQCVDYLTNHWQPKQRVRKNDPI